MELKIARIEMEITLSDGTVVKGHISHTGDNQRYGAGIAHLGACVFPMEEMQRVLVENGHFVPDEEDEEDEEPASCPRCGNTDNDGSDECPDCGETMT